MASEKAECLSVKLDGKNYSVWRFHFQYFLEGKRLWGYVDGSEPQPATIQVKEVAQWKYWDSDEGLHSAKDMWEYLEKVYQQLNFSCKFQVEHDIFIYGQGEKSIQDYYAGLVNPWTEYEFMTMGKITTACCLRAMKDINDEREVMQFLVKLRPDYEIVRANILNHGSPAPPISDEIRHLVQSSVSSAISSAFSAIGLSDASSAPCHNLTSTTDDTTKPLLVYECQSKRNQPPAPLVHQPEPVPSFTHVSSSVNPSALPNHIPFEYVIPLRRSNRTTRPPDRLSLFAHHHLLFSSLDTIDVPTSHQKAAIVPCWKEAMDAEIDALLMNDTWDLVPSPPNASIIVNQPKYTMDSIKCANLTDQKCVETPMEPNLKLKKDAGELLSDPTHYCKLVGRLVYLTMTQPDISYAITNQGDRRLRDSKWYYREQTMKEEASQSLDEKDDENTISYISISFAKKLNKRRDVTFQYYPFPFRKTVLLDADILGSNYCLNNGLNGLRKDFCNWMKSGTGKHIQYHFVIV
ncbi:hypothetical protein RJ639_011121 [Escallonia herrerae]|uniref:Retrotransposon Copia-like N-terminal domain-containing protein n=1 Tax=Escallonia herrerae TaxID=1293975 RepID=A0AA88VP24_9ASTE|nr:hypothetical protein RJ639_011121 [Escallonia herrerae]